MEQNKNSLHVSVRIKVKVMCEIWCVLEGDVVVDSEDRKDLSVSDIMCCTYARMLSHKMERTYSEYKYK
jgi:hypothetical protein